MTANSDPSFDKIRILILDDAPTGLRQSDGPPKVPELEPELQPYFDFRWLATPEEAREFRDLSLALARRDPGLLGARGWIPEIMSIDYFLEAPLSVQKRTGSDTNLYKQLSPLPILREIAQDLPVVQRSVAASLENKEILNWGRITGRFWGCYIGGLLLATFADHPCGPVTVTRYTAQQMCAEGSDASFFEWLMSFETGGLLNAKGLGVSPPWEKIISEGVQSLQTRIQQLAEHGIIALHLDDLLNLADNGTYPTVRFTSRYGTRRLPIAGLFYNIKEENERTEKARSWAAGILNEALAHTGERGDTSAYKTTIADIRDGLALARKLRDAWKSPKVLAHLAFSRSLADARHGSGKSKGAKPTEELTRLMEYAASYGVTPAQLLRDGRSPDLGDTDGDLRAETTSGSVKRWAVLFTIVRLACIAEHVHRMGHEITISDDDVYLSLFPIAKVVPCFLHSREAKNQVYQYLKGMAKDGRSVRGGWGEIGVSVPDILAGLPWNGTHHGVFPFERTVLQWLAAQFGYGNRAEWRLDSTLGRILLGRAK